MVLPWCQGGKIQRQFYPHESKIKMNPPISDRIKFKRHLFQHQNNNHFKMVKKNVFSVEFLSSTTERFQQ